MEQNDIPTNTLEHIHDHHKRWRGKCGVFSIMGSLSMDISSLRVTLHIERKGSRKQRLKLDLYDYAQVARRCTVLCEEEGYVFGELEADLLSLTELLEGYREQQFREDYADIKPAQTKTLPLEIQKHFVSLLQEPSLIDTIKEKLGQIGIAGEENNRLLLFIIGTSYLHTPLHAVIQSSSGSGKSHLINSVAACFPEEDLLSFSRVTSKSLYHYKKDTLKKKQILIQDFDGLDDEALYAFRELQSGGKLTTSMTGKDAFGNHRAKLHTVHGHFASMGATTKDLYTDNASRSILLQMDESMTQTERIIASIPPKAETKTQSENDLQNMIRLLKPQTIINSFADSIVLPPSIPMARRLNTQLRAFIEQITFIHQYQRKQNDKGQLLTTKEDITMGITLFAECLWLKIDELPPATRHFYEILKTYLNQNSEAEPSSVHFNQRELRHDLSISRSALHRHLQTLLKMEYLEIVSGSKNKGYRYAISYIDNAQTKQQALMTELERGLEKI